MDNKALVFSTELIGSTKSFPSSNSNVANVLAVEVLGWDLLGEGKVGSVGRFVGREGWAGWLFWGRVLSRWLLGEGGRGREGWDSA